jgi:serine/threonine-protein kinase
MALDPTGSQLQLCGLLGEGGAGSVYRAVDRATGLTYALKVLSRTTPDGLERFRREAEITAALVHPNIVKIHTAGVREGRPFLAYELVEGARPLDQALAGAPLRRRVEMIRDVARALGHAHRHGVVHRDVKPDNVLVGADGRVRLTDFGIAKSDDYARLTRTGASVGTPSFMAPEQITGERERIGPATDVWALGVMLFQALTGRLPFEADSLPELAARICRGLRETASSSGQGVPRALDVVCQGALASDPTRRYPGGDAVAAALDAWLGGSSPSAIGSAPGGRRVALFVAVPLVVGAVAIGVALLVPTGAPAKPTDPGAPVVAAPTPASPRRELGWAATFAKPGSFELVQTARFPGLDGVDGEDRIEIVLAHAPAVAGPAGASLQARLKMLSFHARVATQVLTYDSREPRPLGLLPAFDDHLRRLDGQEATVSLDLSTGTATRVRGIPTLREDLGDSMTRQMFGMFADAFSDDALLRTLVTALAVFPERLAAATEDGWTADRVVWVGASFGVRLERRFQWRNATTAIARARLDRAPALPVPGKSAPKFTTVEDLRLETVVTVAGEKVVSTQTVVSYREPTDPVGTSRRIEQRWRALAE